MQKIRVIRSFRAARALLRLALHGRFVSFFRYITPCFWQFIYLLKCSSKSGNRRAKSGSGKIDPYIVTIVVSEKCSLKCNHCADLMPRYTTPKDEPIEQIKREADGFFGIADGVGTVVVYGGEPFLAKHLGEALLYLHENFRSRYKQLAVTTNATIVPSDKLCEIMRECLVRVNISDYGVRSAKIDELRHKLNQYGIMNVVVTTKKNYWVDMHRPVPKAPARAAGAFRRCTAASGTCCCLKNGRLYYCTFAANAESIGVLSPDDYSGLPLNASKERAQAYLNRTEPLPACAYCGGTWKPIKDGDKP